MAAAGSSLMHAHCPTQELRTLRQAWERDGVVIARGFLEESTIAAIQRDLENIVDGYARQLSAAGKLQGRDGKHDPSVGLGFAERYTALYQANLKSRANGGLRSDLPTFFRSESHKHSKGTYQYLVHARLHQLMRCLLPHTKIKPPALRLYPVYMLRGKVPDAVSVSNMTVDWHQDAEYTYYWYSNLTTTKAEADSYASAVINTWVAVDDCPLELGPVQLMKRTPRRLTRADFRCEAFGSRGHCSEEGVLETQPQGAPGGGGGREWLRVSQIDQFVEAHPKQLFTAEVARGDVILFDQFTYHRGLPNLSRNRTRWSIDMRFQHADFETLRPDPGFIIGSDESAVAAARAQGAQLIGSHADWVAARPSLRLSEMRAKARNDAIGGNSWAVQHITAHTLQGAVDGGHSNKLLWSGDLRATSAPASPPAYPASQAVAPSMPPGAPQRAMRHGAAHRAVHGPRAEGGHPNATRRAVATQLYDGELGR